MEKMVDHEIEAIIDLLKEYDLDPGVYIAVIPDLEEKEREISREPREKVAYGGGESSAPIRTSSQESGCGKKGLQSGTVKTGRLVLKRNAQKAYDFGLVGTPTMTEDWNGKRLSVGDLVIVEKLVNEMRTGRKWQAQPGLHFVVSCDVPGAESQFAEGVVMASDENARKVGGLYRARLAKTWKEVEIGEEHDGIMIEWEAKE